MTDALSILEYRLFVLNVLLPSLSSELCHLIVELLCAFYSYND